MNNEKQNWFSRLFGSNNSEKNTEGKKNKPMHWIIVLALIGAAIMIFSSFIQVSDEVMPYERDEAPITETTAIITKEDTPKTMQDYEKLYENQLVEIITNMLGVEKVTVKINLDSTEIIEVEKNRTISEQSTKEKDKQGGTREIEDMKRDEQVVLYQNNGNQNPLILKTIKPKVRGVVVVAEGAESVQVKAMIIEAVQKLLDVAPHEIGILPMRK